MDLNKVLEKELDAWLVVGKTYEIGVDKDKPGDEIIVTQYLGRNHVGNLAFENENYYSHFTGWYLAKVGIKEVVDEKKSRVTHDIDLEHEYIRLKIANTKHEFKQKVLAEMDNLILGEKDYISQWSKSIYLDSSEGKVRSAIASLRNLESLKEKINAL